MSNFIYDPQRPLLGHVLNFTCNSFAGRGQVRAYDTVEGYMQLVSLPDAPKAFDQWFPCKALHVQLDEGRQPLPAEALPAQRAAPLPPVNHSATQEKMRARGVGRQNRAGVDHGAAAATEADFAETDRFAGSTRVPEPV